MLAGSIGIGAIDTQLAATVMPISTYVAVTAPLGEKLFEAIRYNGAIADDRRAGDTYRIVSDDRLMWGGRISTRASTPWRLKATLLDLAAVDRRPFQNGNCRVIDVLSQVDTDDKSLMRRR